MGKWRKAVHSVANDGMKGGWNGRQFVVIVRMSRVSPINRAEERRGLAPDFSQTFTFVSLELTSMHFSHPWQRQLSI